MAFSTSPDLALLLLVALASVSALVLVLVFAFVIVGVLLPRESYLKQLLESLKALARPYVKEVHQPRHRNQLEEVGRALGAEDVGGKAGRTEAVQD